MYGQPSGNQTAGFVTTARLDAQAAEDMQRNAQIAARWRAYYGNLPRPLRVLPGAANDNILLGFPRLIVDKGASYLFGKDVTFQVADETTQSEADKWLADCWRVNKGGVRLHALAVNGGVAGHAFVKLRPTAQKGGFPRIVVLDPASVSVLYEPDDYEVVSEYQITTTGYDAELKKLVTCRQCIALDDRGAWWISDEKSVGDGPLVPVGEAEIWPYDFCPLFHCQNLPAPNQFWGESDLESDILEVVNAVNFILSNTAKIIRHHAHPQPFSTGVILPNKIKMAIGELFQLPQGGDLKNLEMTGDLTSSLETYRRLVEVLHALARVPEVATGKSENLGQLSGVALQVMYAPLIEKTETKRRLYGDMLEDVSAALLEMNGMGARFHAGVKPVVSIKWPSVLPSSEAEQAQTAGLWHDLGASAKTLLERAGFDPEMEAANRADEAAAALERQKKAFDNGNMPPGANPYQSNNGGNGA